MVLITLLTKSHDPPSTAGILPKPPGAGPGLLDVFSRVSVPESRDARTSSFLPHPQGKLKCSYLGHILRFVKILQFGPSPLQTRPAVGRWSVLLSTTGARAWLPLES